MSFPDCSVVSRVAVGLVRCDCVALIILYLSLCLKGTLGIFGASSFLSWKTALNIFMFNISFKLLASISKVPLLVSALFFYFGFWRVLMLSFRCLQISLYFLEGKDVLKVALGENCSTLRVNDRGRLLMVLLGLVSLDFIMATSERIINNLA